MIKNLNEIDEMCGVSGVEEVKAYKRHIVVKKYNCLSNEISDDFHTFLEDRLLFHKLNLLIK
jgi:hypothetical protein